MKKTVTIHAGQAVHRRADVHRPPLDAEGVEHLLLDVGAADSDRAGTAYPREGKTFASADNGVLVYKGGGMAATPQMMCSPWVTR